MTIYITYKDGEFNASSEAPDVCFIHAWHEEFLCDIADNTDTAYDESLNELKEACHDDKLLEAIQKEGCLSPAEFQRRIDTLKHLLSNI